MALNVNIGITGDCQNNSSGAISIVPISGVPPYDITISSPFVTAFTSVTAVTLVNLSAQIYNIGVVDSGITVNSFSVEFILSSGFCIDQRSYATSCGLNNGKLSVSATSISYPITYNLYSQTLGLLVDTITANSTDVTFFGLSPDVYYVDVIDYSNCTGRTATCVINNSQDIEFDLFPINNSNCTNTPTGKIYVYNESGGVPPYSYFWQPTLQTTKSISGLSAGAYSVTVTDSLNCSKTKSVNIIDVPKVGITGFVNLYPPDCWQSNGVLQVTITGGTAPYLYQLNSFPPKISLSTTEVFSGLSAGVYNMQITDAGLCFTSGSTTLQTPDSFTIVAINATPSYCNNDSGKIEIILNGGVAPYNFELTDSSGITQVKSQVGVVALFENLKTGTYHLKITNPSDCLYETDVTITNINKFEILTTVNNTTCGGSNGSITIFVNSGGTYSYFINNQSFLNTNQLSHTFNNLTSGLYNVEVKDNSGCSQKTIVSVGSSSNVNFTLIPSSCGLGSDGTISTIITSGKPPFTYNWSSNVNGQNGIYLTGLTAGTYTLQLIDSNGCSSTKSVDVTCLKRYFSYEIYELCDGNFISSSTTKNGIFEMYQQGYLNLTNGEINCKLNTAEFTLKVDVGGTAYTKNFFTTTSLYSYPSDDDYINELKSILQGIPGIGSVIINKNNNTIKVNSDCEKTLRGKNIKVDLAIDYSICCVEPTPTPTVTSTITPTQTPTNTITPTPSLTPTMTLTPTSTQICSNPLILLLNYVESILTGGLSNPSGPSVLGSILNNGYQLTGCVACEPDCEPYMFTSVENYLKIFEFFGINCLISQCCWNIDTTIETFLKYAEAVGLGGAPQGNPQSSTTFGQLTGVTLDNPARFVGDNCVVGSSNLDSSLLALDPLITIAGISILLDKGIIERGLFNNSSILTNLKNYFTIKGLSSVLVTDYLIELLETGLVIDYNGSCDATLYSVDKYLASLIVPPCPTPTTTPAITTTPTITPTTTPTITPSLTQTLSPTALSSICFTIYNGIVFEQVSVAPTGQHNTKPYYTIPSTSTIVWWDNSLNIWKHSSTLGGGTIYDTMSNPVQYPVTLFPTYIWTLVTVGPKNISDSNLSPCFVPPSSTPSNTPTTTPAITSTPTITKTPAITSTPTITKTPAITSTPTTTPAITSTPTITKTPAITSTPTITKTPAITPTQTPTTNVYFAFAGGGTQHPNSTVACTNKFCTRSFYRDIPTWNVGQVVYDNISLTVPTNGNNLWYAIDRSLVFCSGSAWAAIQIGTNGVILNIVSCP